jgi:Concanavalin A-like lectin/glucanases superfamily
MRMSARLLALSLIVIPAVPALAAPAAGPVTVARYTFDAGASAAGRIAENSGRGMSLTVRTADHGAVRFLRGKSGRYVAFPARCASGAATCARALLEAPSDADLNPGTGPFRWGASVSVTLAQLSGSSNVMQKGVTTADSQWKLQIGSKHGRAQCVLVGRGSTKAYIARSSVTVANGAWHKVLCLRSGTTLTVAVDGVSRGRISIPAALSVTNTRPLRVGGPNFNKSSDMYHGYVDDVLAARG